MVVRNTLRALQVMTPMAIHVIDRLVYTFIYIYIYIYILHTRDQLGRIRKSHTSSY